jgi:bifunctional DNase/RNase
MAMLDMKVSQLTVDPFTNMPLVILADADGKEAVPIWVGPTEASAIASELEKIPLARPMTHDLLKTLVLACGSTVARVEIRDVRGTTFYAAIVLMTPAGEKVVDARPADANALALRVAAPIRVARKVIDRARAVELPTAALAATDLAERELLESLSDEDFGKWKM